MNSDAGTLMEEPELLNEVPPILKRLAKTVAYAFYEPELIVTISILTKFSCLDEDTMLERLQFDKRQMRQVLGKLKNDKLIKQRTVKEKQQESNNFNVYNFYFINYKVFVNVVKYKLDHIRKKLEQEEQQARNRPSFQCQQCRKNFSDLEVDRLVDFETGDMHCSFCNGTVEEDNKHVNSYINGSSLGKFNEQMEAIFNLLKECENINLAPEVLEPTPSTAEIKASGHRSHGSSNKSGWSKSKTSDLYDQTFQINVGDEVTRQETRTAKELPVWMAQSTVFKEESNDSVSSSNVEGVTAGLSATSKEAIGENEIMSDLLAYETSSKKTKYDSVDSALKVEESIYSANEPSSSQEGTSTVTEVVEEMDSEEDEPDEEVRVKVGDKFYALDDITEEITAQMTDSEHETYLKLYNEAYNQYY